MCGLGGLAYSPKLRAPGPGLACPADGAAGDTGVKRDGLPKAFGRSQEAEKLLSAQDTNGPIKPVKALLDADRPGVLALIVGTEGPSYRPIGAMMAVFDDKRRVGSLSSGCVEADIAQHALAALDRARPTELRYGRGSPYFDIQLPCGGGLDILLLPHPDRMVLQHLVARHEGRETVTLSIDTASGYLTLLAEGETGRTGDRFTLRIEPDLMVYTFGKGPEASGFAALVQSLGFPGLLLSPDDETLERGADAGCAIRHLTSRTFPDDLAVDDRCAITLFFHDHDWEPPVLSAALETPAVYIGAQGSQRARDMRLAELEAMGVPEAARARLVGPVGLIPSARDPQTLAVSVLAEILAKVKGSQ